MLNNKKLFEYKGIALHNSRKSIGTPEGIEHYYKEGYIELNYYEYNSYAFIYNKNNNNIIFSNPGETHIDTFEKYIDTEEGSNLELNKLKSTKQLRYTGPYYKFRETDPDPKQEMSKWHEENIDVLKIFCEGRLWYIDNITYELLRYNEDYVEEHPDEFENLPMLNKNIKAYIVFWNEITSNKFKEICDNIICKFNATHDKEYKIIDYIAVGNNGEPINMCIKDILPIYISKRQKKYQDKIDQEKKNHNGVTAIDRKNKILSTELFRLNRDSNNLINKYNNVHSKTEAEWRALHTNENYFKITNIKKNNNIINNSRKMLIINHIINGDTNLTSDDYHLVDNFYIVDTKKELEDIIEKSIKYFGNNCNLNWINTSRIDDMSYLFAGKDNNKNIFDGFINHWNVSNVTNMEYMFYNSEFDNTLNKWDVSNVVNMKAMFSKSEFDCKINKWDVSNVTDMSYMFYESKFNNDISLWDVSNVTDMSFMFTFAYFNNNISNWKINRNCTVKSFNKYSNLYFSYCPIYIKNNC